MTSRLYNQQYTFLWVLFTTIQTINVFVALFYKCDFDNSRTGTMNVKTNDSVIKNQPQICRLCLAFTTTCYSLIEDTKVSGMLEALTSLRVRSFQHKSPLATYLIPDFTLRRHFNHNMPKMLLKPQTRLHHPAEHAQSRAAIPPAPLSHPREARVRH